MEPRCYLVMSATHQTMRAEKLLLAAGLPVKVVMKPQRIKSDCSLAIRADPADLERVLALLEENGLRPRGVHHL